MTKPITLRDYTKLDVYRIYLVDDVQLSFDGKFLSTLGQQEREWQSLFEFDEQFIQWIDRELTETNNYYC